MVHNIHIDTFEAAIKKAIAGYFYESSFRKMSPGICVGMFAKVEKAMLEQVLHAVRGNQSRAAELMDMNRNTLRKRCSEHGIKPLDYTPYGALQARN